MATTVPACAKLTLGGTTLQDAFTAFHAWLDAAPGAFTLLNEVGGGAPTSFTIEHDDGWQQNFRISGGTLLSLIAPTGGILSSTSPGTPTGAMTEDVLLPAFSGTIAEANLARYDDALLFGVKATGGTHWALAYHSGRIAVPDDASDAALGADGLGVLAYLPLSTSTATLGYWFSTIAADGSRKSKVRVGASTWGSPTCLRDYGTAVTAVRVNKRFVPAKLVVPDSGAPAPTSSPDYGALKYIRGDGASTLSPFQVAPSAGSEQAWMAIYGTNTATRFRCLWNKLVTP